MKINEVTEQAMDREEMGMGLAQYTGQHYGLVGGMRSGNSPAGQTRLKFMIFDIEAAKRDPNAEDVMLGYVELMVEDGTQKIVGLVNIKLDPKNRKAGVGAAIINDIVDTAGGRLEIHDVKKGARGFWKKMGIVYPTKRYNHGYIDHNLNEISYEGNVGMQEVFQFTKMATDEQREQFQHYMGDKDYKSAWQLVNKVTGVKLQHPFNKDLINE